MSASVSPYRSLQLQSQQLQDAVRDHNRQQQKVLSSPRPMTMQSLYSSMERDPTEDAGVGLYLQQDVASSLSFVKDFAPNGSAQRSSMVNFGDVVTHIDGERVEGLPLRMLRNKLVGPPGSIVRVSMRKLDGTAYTVPLLRESHGKPTAVVAPQDHVAKKDYDTLKVAYGLMVDEVARLKALLNSKKDLENWAKALEEQVVSLMSRSAASEEEIATLMQQLKAHRTTDYSQTHIGIENESLRQELASSRAVTLAMEREIAAKNKELSVLRDAKRELDLVSRHDSRDAEIFRLQSLLRNSEAERHSLEQERAQLRSTLVASGYWADGLSRGQLSTPYSSQRGLGF